MVMGVRAPVIYEIDERRRLLYASIRGELSPRLTAAALDRLMADSRFGPDAHGLIDLRSRRGPSALADALQQLFDVLRPVLMLPVRRRCALIVRPGEHDSVERAAESLNLRSYVRFRVFTDECAARQWLGVEEPSRAPHRDAEVAVAK